MVGFKDALTGKLTMFPDGDFTWLKIKWLCWSVAKRPQEVPRFDVEAKQHLASIHPSKIDQANSENWDVFDRLFSYKNASPNLDTVQ